jgi:hypothetical protein
MDLDPDPFKNSRSSDQGPGSAALAITIKRYLADAAHGFLDNSPCCEAQDYVQENILPSRTKTTSETLPQPRPAARTTLQPRASSWRRSSRPLAPPCGCSAHL